MSWHSLPSNQLFSQLRTVLSYQFNSQVADALLQDFSSSKCVFSKNTGKIKHVQVGDIQLLNYKPTLGLFSLSLEAAARILKVSPSPRFRVVVQSDVSEFIATGKSVFIKHVKYVDPALRVGDEVIVVNEQDDLLAIGKLNHPPCIITPQGTGVAVKVRRGIHAADREKEKDKEKN